ncbi:MAG: hypothetical protein U0640_10010 [Phycisphaerales bacterium]
MATAQSVTASLSFDQMEASYHVLSPTTGTLTATSVDQIGLRTVGDFSRSVTPRNNADFPQGFANINLSLAIQRVSDTFATANGTLTIVDVDGDNFSTTVSSDMYLLAPGFYFFSDSQPAPVQFVTNDGFFNGVSGSWPIDGAMTSAFATILPLGLSAPGFFTEDFSSPLALSGQLIPSPTATPMLLVGTLIIARTRRR